MYSIRTVLLLVALVVLSGCATSGFEEYYSPNPRSDRSRLLRPTGDPKIYAMSADPQSDIRRLMEDGYEVIGQASFNGPPADRDDLAEQAEDVDAELVLVKSQYSHTVSGTMALPMYNPGQTVVSTTQANASAYGTGGSAYGTYRGTTTTQLPGTTTYMPMNYNVARYDQSAVFFGKIRPESFCLGAYWNDLPAETRAQLQRNQGVILELVVTGSPAYRANLFPGDIVWTIDGAPVMDSRSFDADISRAAGRTVTLGILRKEQPLNVPVTLNPQFVPPARQTKKE